MVSTLSEQILLVARRDSQDPVRRVLKEAGLPFVAVDSPAAVVRTAERVRPTVIVLEAGAAPAPIVEALAAFAEAQHVQLLRDWPTVDVLLVELRQALGKPDVLAREARRIVAGPLILDLTGHETLVDGSRLDLTAREFELVCHLARHPGWVFSRQELLEQVWGYEFGDPRVVTVHMANLRKKLDAASPGAALIETVRGVGYKLVVPEVTAPREAGAHGGVATLAAEEPGSDGGEAAAPEAVPSSDAPAADERRLVTMLALDLGGLTAFAESSPFDCLSELVNSLFERLEPCIRRYGGRVDRFTAHSAMASFGAPTAQDNDAEMAIRAALDVVSAVDVIAEEYALPGLSVGIGVSTGVAVVGTVNGRASPGYSIVGEVVDLAARLAGHAGPKEVLVGADTYRLVAPMVEAQALGELKLRGWSRDFPYFRVERVFERNCAHGALPGVSTSIVGRDDQLALIRGVLERLKAGIGGVVCVSGEAGIGKSRLAAEAQTLAASLGLRWLQGNTAPYGRSTGFLPFASIVQADCAIGPNDSESERKAKLARRLTRLFADRGEDVLSALAGILDLRTPDGVNLEAAGIPGDNTFPQTLDRLVAYLTRLGTERSTVVTIEDLHWLDNSSFALLERLTPLTATSPLVLFLTGRGDSDSSICRLAAWARSLDGVRLLELPLPALSPRETYQLVTNLLGAEGLEPRVRQIVDERAEGNPFFAEEVIRHLVGLGIVRRDENGTWELAGSRTDISMIPDTLKGVITARIDALPVSARETLRRAAIVGRSFPRELLAAVAPDTEPGLDDDLRCLLDRQLIEVRDRGSKVLYSFRHALVQEAAYGTLLPRQRRRLHVAVAEAIRSSGVVGDMYGSLAYHYTRAEDWRAALDHLVQAGDQAISKAADPEAVTYYQDAMAAVLRMFEDNWGDPESFETVQKLVKATDNLSLPRCLGELLESAQVFYERILAACGPCDPRTLAATALLATCQRQRRQYEAATTLIETALAACPASAEDDPSFSRLIFLLACCRMNMDEYSGTDTLLVRAFEKEKQKRTPDRTLLYTLLLALMEVYQVTASYDRLQEVSEESTRMFGPDDEELYWSIIIELAKNEQIVGHWDRAVSYARQGLDNAASPVLRAFAAWYLGVVRTEQGAYLEAEEHLRWAVARFEERDMMSAAADTLIDLGETQLRAEKWDEAEGSVRKGLELMGEFFPADHSRVACAWWTLAGVAMARGDLERAETLLADSSRLVGQKYADLHWFRPELLFRRAQLCAVRGLPEESQSHLREAVDLLIEIGGDEHPRIAQMKPQCGMPGR